MTQILWLPQEQLAYLPEMAHVIAGTQAHLRARELAEAQPWQHGPATAPASPAPRGTAPLAAMLTVLPLSLTLIGALVLLHGVAAA